MLRALLLAICLASLTASPAAAQVFASLQATPTEFEPEAVINVSVWSGWVENFPCGYGEYGEGWCVATDLHVHITSSGGFWADFWEQIQFDCCDYGWSGQDSGPGSTLETTDYDSESTVVYYDLAYGSWYDYVGYGYQRIDPASPIITGEPVVWYFDGLNLSDYGYQTTVTLTSSYGSFTSWEIILGADKERCNHTLMAPKRS